MPTAPKYHQPFRPAYKPHDIGSRNRPGGQWLHSARWRKARKMFLSVNPLCVDCQGRGEMVAATVVDHITPHVGDSEMFWDQSNWQPLCASCHSRKTASEDGGFGNRKGEGSS